MLGKNDLASEVEAKIGVKKNLVKNVMDAIAEIAEEQLKLGHDFSVPGVARISYGYVAPFKKGDVFVDPFSKEEKTRDKSRKAAIKIRALPAPALKRMVAGMSMQSKAAKAVVDRKAR